MTASNTGDVLLSASALHAQQHLAVWTFKIPVIPAVFCALDELAELCFPAGGQLNILPVFRAALFVVSGKHAEQRQDIKHKSQQGEKNQAGKTAKQGEDQAGKQRKNTQVIRAVAALHETGEGFLDSLPEGHSDHSSNIFLYYSSNQSFVL